MNRKISVLAILTISMFIFCGVNTVFAAEATDKLPSAQTDQKSSAQIEQEYEEAFAKFRSLVNNIPEVMTGHLVMYRSTLNNILLWSGILGEYTNIERRYARYLMALKFESMEKGELTDSKLREIDENVARMKRITINNAEELTSRVIDALDQCEDIRSGYSSETGKDMNEVYQEDMAKYLENNENKGRYEGLENMLVVDYSLLVSRVKGELGLWTKKKREKGLLPPM